MKLLPWPTSSLAKKYVTAVTGTLLILFVLAHMAGNLLIFAGPDALNSYAHHLQSLGPLLWVARIGLLVIFVIHLLATLQLRHENAKARPQRYAYEQTLQASWASRHMLLTGVVLLLFVLYHLAHFTFGVVKKTDFQVASASGTIHQFDDGKRNYRELVEEKQGNRYVPRPDKKYSDFKNNPDADIRHDVYSMVVSGFRDPLISSSYLLAMIFLALHLWHGGSSFLQTLGANNPAWAPYIARLGPVLAILVLLGNSSIVLAVWLRIVN